MKHFQEQSPAHCVQVMQADSKKKTKQTTLHDLYFPPLPVPKSELLNWLLSRPVFQIHFKDHQLGIRGFPAKCILSMGTDVRCVKQQ